MMYAPFIKDSDGPLSQLAQLQIFLTLLSSLSLLATPPSEFVSNLVTIVLFAVPLLGLALETPLLDVLKEAKAKIGELIVKSFPNCKPPSAVVRNFKPPSLLLKSEVIRDTYSVTDTKAIPPRYP